MKQIPLLVPAWIYELERYFGDSEVSFDNPNEILFKIELGIDYTYIAGGFSNV